MRWYAGRRGNDQVAHYFAADRCVKEPVYLPLESRRAVATARSAALTRDHDGPHRLHHPPGHDPDPQNRTQAVRKPRRRHMWLPWAGDLTSHFSTVFQPVRVTYSHPESNCSSY
jgi:hypothetical protein